MFATFSTIIHFLAVSFCCYSLPLICSAFNINLWPPALWNSIRYNTRLNFQYLKSLWCFGSIFQRSNCCYNSIIYNNNKKKNTFWLKAATPHRNTTPDTHSLKWYIGSDMVRYVNVLRTRIWLAASWAALCFRLRHEPATRLNLSFFYLEMWQKINIFLI